MSFSNNKDFLARFATENPDLWEKFTNELGPMAVSIVNGRLDAVQKKIDSAKVERMSTALQQANEDIKRGAQNFASLKSLRAVLIAVFEETIDAALFVALKGAKGFF